ncbi:MAG TPA: peptide ABC transporter permease [Elusimicrobia bacterium]|jgi:peptide/nickel transport system permease protein|nr:peptide ABC transporter permease [Elusimicrobiota bacterium]
MWKIYWRRLKRNKLALSGLSIILFLTILAIFAPLLTPYNPLEQNLLARLSSPSKEHWFGTDDLGRDVFSRIIYGTRISLTVGFVAIGIAIIIGTIIGLISGYFAKKIDLILMRFVDIMLCFPAFFLILMVIAFLEPNIYNVMIVIGLTSWPGLARLVRGECLSIKEREFISAAKILGLSTIRILFVHILPNVLAPVLVSATLGVGSAILIESGLSFLGLGVQPPTPSWGNILTSGKDYIYLAWWLSVFPGLAILITVLAYNLLGEGLRDIFDPRTFEG